MFAQKQTVTKGFQVGERMNVKLILHLGSHVHRKTWALFLFIVQTRKPKWRAVNTSIHGHKSDAVPGLEPKDLSLTACVSVLHCLLHCITLRTAKEILIM